MARYEVWIIMNSPNALLVDTEQERSCDVTIVGDVITEDNLMERFQQIANTAWNVGRIPKNEEIDLVTFPEGGEFVSPQGNA